MNFQYKVRNSEGQIVTAFIEAPSRIRVFKDLHHMGMQPIAVIPAPLVTLKPGTRGLWEARAKRKFQMNRRNLSVLLYQGWGKLVPDQEILIFTRDLLSLVRSGVPLVSGLHDISVHARNPYFKQVLEDICEDLNAGNKLSDAFEKYPRIFTDFYWNTVRAGEKSGWLEAVLEHLTKTLDENLERQLMIKDAIRYPIIVLVALAIAFVMIISFVIPKISHLFAQFKTELPLPTRMVIGLGDFCHHYGTALLFLGLVSIFFVSVLKKNERGRLVWDQVMLRLPVFGGLFTKIAISQFAASFQVLHASGVVVPEALKISSSVADNKVIGRGIALANEKVNRGLKLSDALKETRLFPALVVRMVMMGEKTGHLEEMMKEVIHYYDRDIRYMTKNMTALLEPILTVCLGLMVMFFAFGVFLPMWNVMNLFRHHV